MKKVTFFITIILATFMITAVSIADKHSIEYPPIEYPEFITLTVLAEKLDYIIQLLEEPQPCAHTCNGDLSAEGRWCDNLDGTVKDMSTGLIWLQDAGWGGQKPWRHPTNYDDAHMQAGILHSGTAGAGLSDGSQKRDWRLPTTPELRALIEGVEAVSSSNMQFFTNVQPDKYWSSGSYGWDHPQLAIFVNMSTGEVSWNEKYGSLYVWPVRNSAW